MSKLSRYYADLRDVWVGIAATTAAANLLMQRTRLHRIRTKQAMQSQRELNADASMNPKYLPIRAKQGRLLG
jgi:hypothetical protein